MCLSQFELLKQKYHTLGGLNNKYLFLTFLETWDIQDLVPDESTLLGLQTAISHCILTQWRTEGTNSPISSYNSTNPIHEGSTVMTKLLFTICFSPANIITVGIRMSTQEF